MMIPSSPLWSMKKAFPPLPLLLSVGTLFLACCSTVSAAESTSAGAGNPKWNIYHSWNGGQDYTHRGVIEYQSPTDTDSQTAGQFLVTNNENALTHEQVQAMLDYGWYQVKIDTKDNDYVLATVPACHLRRANFRDEFIITLPRLSSPDQQQITSLAYNPLISPLAPKSCDDPEWKLKLPDSIQFTSKVTPDVDTPGISLRAILPTVKPPPGMSWLPHPSRSKTTPDGRTVPLSNAGGASSPNLPPGAEEPSNNKPWFIKYWYIVLPLALANFMGGSDPQQQQQPAAGQPQSASGQPQASAMATGPAPTTMPAATGPSSSSNASAARRRGKRG